MWHSAKAPSTTRSAGARPSAVARARGGWRGARPRLAPKRIRVNVISPGVVRTPQSDAFLQALPAEQRAAIEGKHLLGLGAPDDVAGAAAFLLSGDARWITGINLIADGGLTLQ